jgi:glycosyltransferase involved in cell wall biosynthesis
VVQSPGSGGSERVVPSFATAGAHDHTDCELLTPENGSPAMRVLGLTNLYPNQFNPHLAPFNRHLFRVLGVRNQVRVISPIPWTVEARAWWKGAAPLPADRRAELDGLAVDHPRYYFPPKVLQRTYGLLFEMSVRQVFCRRAAEFRPDQVLASWAYPDGWAAVRLARQAGLPVVIQVLGSDVLLLTGHTRRRQLTFDALRAADGVVAVSRDLADRVIDGGVDPDKVRVVYGGVDPAWFHPGPKPDARLRVGLDPDGDPLLLFIGNLVKVKGIDILIDACSVLAKAGRRFQCRIIGQGPLAGLLRARIDRLGLGERVKLLGPKRQEDLPDWYRAADVFVLPSHSEGVPNVLMEAAACGLPCVASRVGGVPEISDRGDIRMVPPADPTALAGAIGVALAGQDRPRAVTSPRAWAESIDELERFLAGVLDRAPARQPARQPALVPA